MTPTTIRIVSASQSPTVAGWRRGEVAARRDLLNGSSGGRGATCGRGGAGPYRRRFQCRPFVQAARKLRPDRRLPRERQQRERGRRPSGGGHIMTLRKDDGIDT